VLVTETLDHWLATAPSYERLDAELSLELRPVPVRKSLAVAWARQQIAQGATARVLALGDDFTDEDTFRALGVHDDAVLVGHSEDPERSSFAHW
jgi:trehalose 6-phosphate synthase